MTGLIIFLARWRMARGLSPSPIDVALEHVIWLRNTYPEMTPREAAATIGVTGARSWADVIRAFADTYMGMKHQANGGNNG